MGKMVNELNKTFKNKRVLITGDTGFKGSWLALWLKELGADVLGYALPPKHKFDHYNSINLKKIITHVNGDIRDLDQFRNVCNKFKPEFLFHLAAQPLVRLSYNEPHLTYETNVLGSVNILETVRTSKTLKSVVYITSDKCYKNKEWLWGYRENDELGGYDPYSASKSAAEIIFQSYLNSYFKGKKGLGIASVRAGNVIGGGDFSVDRLIPDCIKALMANKPIKIRNPKSTRPWQHVLEPLSGYLLLASRLYKEPKKYSTSWNFGPSDKSFLNVGEVVSLAVKYWGKGKVVFPRTKKDFHEAGLLQLNCDKAHQVLKWNPLWNTKVTLNETLYWYKMLDQNKNMLDVSRNQIRKYMEG